MLVLAAAIGVAVLALWLQGSIFVLRLLVQPDILLALIVAVAAAFAFHAHCVVDAYKCARRARIEAGRGRGRMSGRVTAIVLLLGVLTIPYAAAAYYDFRSYDLLTSVFADEEPLDFQPPPQAPSGDGSGGPSFPPDPSRGPEAPAAAASTQEEPQEPAEKPSYWQDRGRLNFLLVGGDAGPGRWGLRTDTMIVVSVSPKTGRGAIFSVPRNFQSVPFPESAQTSLTAFPDILNALWGYAESHPDLFPGAKRPGPTALKETIGNLLGLEIDYYAAVDLRGFVEVIDAVGGVTVDVQSRVYDAGVSPPYEGEPWIVVDLQPGRQHMDGRLALGYVRTRWATSDYDRMQRQRCLIGSLMQQASVPKLLRSFPKIASAIKQYAETDVPLRALPDLMEVLAELDPKGMVAVSFVPPRFGPVPDVDLMRRTVKEALRQSPTLGETTGLESLKGSCA